jgi:hypothetical protein
VLTVNALTTCTDGITWNQNTRDETRREDDSRAQTDTDRHGCDRPTDRLSSETSFIVSGRGGGDIYYFSLQSAVARLLRAKTVSLARRALPA